MRKVLELASVRAVLTDFDRTLTRLFDDQRLDDVRAELADLYAARHVPVHELPAGNAYALWVDAYDWMTHHGRADVDTINQKATNILGNHEYEAAKESSLLHGVSPVLEWLDDERIQVAIVSTNATKAVELVLKENGVDHLVFAVLGRDDQVVDMAKLKPDPSSIHDALEKMHDPPALLVGDSTTDILAGRRSGLPTVGVTTGEISAQALMAAGADVVIPSFAELRSLLENR